MNQEYLSVPLNPVLKQDFVLMFLSKMMYYVYLLKGSKYYVGSTNNIKRRLQEHARGTTYTINKQIGEYKLLGYFEFKTELEARKYEKYIKKNGHYERLQYRKNFIEL